MLVTAIALIIAIIIVMPTIKSGWYMLHIAIILSLAFIMNGSEVAFSNYAISTVLLLHFMSINIVTFLAYAYDKRAAKKRKWRIPERVLHSLALAGGTPLAYFAAKIFHHKTSKKTFRKIFWIIAVIQIIIIIILLYFS